MNVGLGRVRELATSGISGETGETLRIPQELLTIPSLVIRSMVTSGVVRGSPDPAHRPTAGLPICPAIVCSGETFLIRQGSSEWI